MVVPWLPVPKMPTPELFLAMLVVVPGMLYNTQFHFVVPSPGSVVIISANSLVPSGAFDQDNAGEDPVPSQVYSAGSVPPTPTSFVSKKDTVELFV